MRTIALLFIAASAYAAPVRLFNGHDLGGWRMRTAHATNWTVSNGELVNLRAGSNLVSTALFGDFRLHLEYNCPPHSNSGVFLRGRYEVQIFDEAEADAMSRTGAIYNVLPAEGPARLAGRMAVDGHPAHRAARHGGAQRQHGH